MSIKLENCDVGDYVSVWCEGIARFDNEVCKILSKGLIQTEVKYKDGTIINLSNSLECKKINF